MTAAESVFVPIDNSIYDRSVAAILIAAAVAFFAVVILTLVRRHLDLAEWWGATVLGLCAASIVMAVGIVGHFSLAPSLDDLAAGTLNNYLGTRHLEASLPEGVHCDLDTWACLQAASIEGHDLVGITVVAGDPYVELERTGGR